MFSFDKDEIFFKSLSQCNSTNFHRLSIHPAEYVVLITLDGICYRYSINDGDKFHFLDADLKNLVCTKKFLLVSSALVCTESVHYLIAAARIDSQLKLTLFELNEHDPWLIFLTAFTVEYYPCIIKTLPQLNSHSDSKSFIVSGSDKTVSVYDIDSGKICKATDHYFTNFYENLELPGVVICIDFSNPTQSIDNFLALGFDTGDIIVYQLLFIQSGVEILKIHAKKYDTPISFVEFISQPCTLCTNDATSIPLYLLCSPALGPALISTVSEHCIIPHSKRRPKSRAGKDVDEDSFREYLTLPVSDRYDAIVCCCHLTTDENTEFFVALGTFSCKLLIYKVILQAPNESCELILVREFLSPVVSMKRFEHYWTILTCTGFYVFEV